MFNSIVVIESYPVYTEQVLEQRSRIERAYAEALKIRALLISPVFSARPTEFDINRAINAMADIAQWNNEHANDKIIARELLCVVEV